MPDATLLALIDLIYQGATDAGKWPDIVSQVAAWVGVDKALLFTPLANPQTNGFSFSHGLKPEALQAWANVKQSADLWTQRATERRLMFEGNIVADSELVTEAKFVQSAWYQDFLKHQDIGRMMAGIVFGNASPTIPSVGLSCFRSLSRPGFSAEDKAKLGIVLPHLSRALGVMLTLREAEVRVASSRQVLDQVKQAMVVLNADETVAYANPSAEHIFRRKDGVTAQSVSTTGGRRLRIADAEARQAFQTAVLQALSRQVDTAHFNHRILVDRSAGGVPYSLAVSAIDGGQALHLPTLAKGVAVFITDPDAPLHMDEESIQRCYGLTAAELRVALNMLNGDEGAELAQHLGLSLSTVKTHIARIYAKMGLSTRAAFVKAMFAHAR